ncbi:50S ribosomal protein L15 [Candidatus Gottesmanbacteria bacterium]|nr:50S ribosomal protein L15 [Candidatus Gottesmanbacteria bacterium]MBI3560027.1 50S ribosomal protein L15 [Candidatus Gottesmanbacteria bacterium]
MKLHELPTIISRSKKRLGRGHGSGKVKTSGRGTKGQKARSSMPIGFEGGQSPLFKRLPLLRGKGRNQSAKPKAFPVAVTKLADLPKGTVVTLETLKKYRMISEDVSRVKVLGGNKLSVALTVKVACSKSARKSVIAAGGLVE